MLNKFTSDNYNIHVCKEKFRIVSHTIHSCIEEKV